MSDKNQTFPSPAFLNASVLALVAVLAMMLYVLGVVMSGDTTQLTGSVRGADVIDTRDVPN